MTQEAPPAGFAYASWIARVGASIIDWFPVVALFTFLAVAYGETHASNGSFSVTLNGFPALVHFAVTLGWFAYNWVIRQGRSAQTIGKKIVGIGVYRAGTSEPMGEGLTIARQLSHLLDAIPCGIGFLWPLWDKEKRTFADMVIESRVYKV